MYRPIMPPRKIAVPVVSGCSSATFPAPALTSKAPGPLAGWPSKAVRRPIVAHRLRRRAAGGPKGAGGSPPSVVRSRFSSVWGRGEARGQGSHLRGAEVGAREARQLDEGPARVATQTLEHFVGDAAVGAQARGQAQGRVQGGIPRGWPHR